MQVTEGERGVAQTAYQIQVRDPTGASVWNSNKVDSADALGVLYAGSPLKAATRYSWTLTAWNQADAKLVAQSWFETGLMDPAPDSTAWGGAQWIGGSDDDLVLYSPYLAVFDLKYALTISPGSTHASFVFGANDSRLMDKNKNIFQLQNAKDESYIKLELNISGVDGTPDGRATLNVYRAGYNTTDTQSKPMKTFDIATGIINVANRNAEHVVEFSSAFGKITISIDGQASLASKDAKLGADAPSPFGPAPNSINLNPLGSGGNFIPFGMLCDIGFAVESGQAASFRDVTVRNTRLPKNILFHEDLAGSPYKGIFADLVDTNSGFSVSNGSYNVSGGNKGALLLRNPSRNSMPMLRTTFKTSGKAMESARLYITARGIYEAFLNGKRIGTDYLNPGLTQYNVTHMYQAYDVTSMVKAGNNTMGAMLGEGWWSGLLSFGDIWNHFGDRQSLLAKLVVTYKDGSSETIVSNPQTWRYYGHGPVIYSSLDFGEIYDSSRDLSVAGWATAKYDDSKWKNAVSVPLEGTTFAGKESGFLAPPTPFTFDKLSLIGQVGESAGIYRTLAAQSVKEVRPGVFVYNLGQNIVGVPRISIGDGQAYGNITLRYSEILYPDLPDSGRNVGMLMTENYRAALSQDVYMIKPGRQTFQPHFTFRGFQYIEVTGIEKPLPLQSVQGIALSSVHELTADYKTSNARVNRLWSNLVWSNVDNFLTIPTDCPQRNERMGWSGDLNVFSHTATYVSNSDQFMERHMYAMRDVQLPSGKFTDIAPIGGGFGGVLWGSAGIVVPWETYRQYQDTGLLEQHYPAMVAYMDYLETTIDLETGLSSDGQLGDWLGPQNEALGTDFLVTAYHAYDLGIIAKVAQILGKSTDAQKYTERYAKRKAFFNTTFVNADKKSLGTTGGGRAFPGRPAKPLEFRVADTQTSYAVGLGMDLFNDENKPYMIRNLAETVSRENKDDAGTVRPVYSLMTGFIGTSWISNALSDNGHSDLAYRILQNAQYPSWLYAIDQGATSIWERLNGYTVDKGFGGNNSMNSFNHYSFGAVGQWMVGNSLGIQRDEPGFKKFILQPEPDPTGTMTFAEGYYDSMYGRISSSWKLNGEILTYRATIPPNTTAILYLPATAHEDVREGGKVAGSANGVRFVKFANGKAVYELQSGNYEFTTNM
jgi:alpha-L-rhamnosidase